MPERFVTKLGIYWIRFVKSSALGLTITADHHYAKFASLGSLVLSAWVDQSHACWPFVRWSVFCEYRVNFGTFVKTPYKTDLLNKLNSTPSVTDYVLLSKSCFVTAVILALTSDYN